MKSLQNSSRFAVLTAADKKKLCKRRCETATPIAYGGNIIMAYKIYIADDEKNIRELLKNFLESDGYEVSAFETGDLLLFAFEKEPADLVILDIMMPGKDGIECVKELRKISSVPIILLTAKDGELDFVNGITLGSDDYLTKPFRPTVLLMRVKALLRRAEMNGSSKEKSKVWEYADLTYSEDERSVRAGKTVVPLTKTEMSVFAFMVKEPQKTHSRDSLLDEVWGFSARNRRNDKKNKEKTVGGKKLRDDRNGVGVRV